jgi:hypothetical protein
MTQQAVNLAPILRRMAADIEQFDQHKIDLKRLIGLLMDETANVPDECHELKQKIEDCWSEMETIYAIETHHGKEKLDDDDAAKVYDLIDELKAVIAPHINA